MVQKRIEVRIVCSKAQETYACKNTKLDDTHRAAEKTPTRSIVVLEVATMFDRHGIVP